MDYLVATDVITGQILIGADFNNSPLKDFGETEEYTEMVA